MDKTLWDFPFFKPAEFDSPDKPDSGLHMNYNLMVKLVSLRRLVGRPFIITSGFRTKAHNIHLKSRGYKASPDSAHLKGMAADISCPDSSFRYEFLNACYKIGVDRIGIGKNFIHVDIDGDKPQDIIWTY